MTTLIWHCPRKKCLCVFKNYVHSVELAFASSYVQHYTFIHSVKGKNTSVPNMLFATAIVSAVTPVEGIVFCEEFILVACHVIISP